MANDIYFMPRDSEEAVRVNRQGHLLESVLDYQLHPNVESVLSAKPRIADIGTATGDFLIRLSTKYPPDSEYYGFDISPNQFCPPSDRPDNLQLQVHDLTKTFPAELHNTFDLVHFRMLQAGLSKDDWVIGVKNATDLLRPGGAIQWEEADLARSKRLRSGGAKATAKNLDAAIRPFIERNISQMQYGPSDLATIFREAGLTDVEQDVVSSDRLPETRERSSMNFLKAAMGSMRKLKAQGRDVDFWQGLGLDEVERRALEDIAHGAYTRTDVYCTVGVKPAQNGKI